MNFTEWILQRGIPEWAAAPAGVAAGLAVILILYGAARWVLLRGLAVVVKRLVQTMGMGREAYGARLRTLQALLSSVISYGLGFMALVMALRIVGLDVGPLLAGAGVVGLAIGFGAQRLVRDVITGIFILLEDQFAVGDFVTIGAFSGTVTEMGMRITRLRDEQGKEIILANGDISTVVNHSRSPLLASIDVSVAAATPLARVREVIQGLGPQLPPELFAEPARVQGITAMDGAKVVVRVTAAAQPGAAARAEMVLREAVHQALTQAAIPLV